MTESYQHEFQAQKLLTASLQAKLSEHETKFRRGLDVLTLLLLSCQTRLPRYAKIKTTPMMIMMTTMIMNMDMAVPPKSYSIFQDCQSIMAVQDIGIQVLPIMAIRCIGIQVLLPLLMVYFSSMLTVSFMKRVMSSTCLVCQVHASTW